MTHQNETKAMDKKIQLEKNRRVVESLPRKSKEIAQG